MCVRRKSCRLLPGDRRSHICGAKWECVNNGKRIMKSDANKREVCSSWPITVNCLWECPLKLSAHICCNQNNPCRLSIWDRRIPGGFLAGSKTCSQLHPYTDTCDYRGKMYHGNNTNSSAISLVEVNAWCLLLMALTTSHEEFSIPSPRWKKVWVCSHLRGKRTKNL